MPVVRRDGALGLRKRRDIDPGGKSGVAYQWRRTVARIRPW